MPAVGLQNGLASSSSKGAKQGKLKEKVRGGAKGKTRAGPSTLPQAVAAKPKIRKSEEEKAVANGSETPTRVKKKGEKEGTNKRKAPVASSSSSSRASRVAGEGETIGNDLSSTCRFPMSRVKRIVGASEGERRGGGSGIRPTNEAVFLANKAAELFLELFTKDAYACAKRDRKKFLSYKHLSFSVCNKKRYEFLSDFVPEKLSAEEALKAKALAE